VLPGADGEEALAVAERCRVALLALEVHGVPVSCSAGVASFPADDRDGHRLLELADGALYHAKQAGRSQVRRYDAREVILLSSSEQRAQIRGLLSRPEALTPVFQPVVELTTGRIAGYEALTRFLDVEPVRPPDVWFAQARRCGLGPALEARAIERALAVPGRPEGTFLTLNVSPAALLSPEVEAVLPAGLGDIVVELTEDALFSCDEGLELALARLRSRGARIAVDDAGAGYSGLQQLVRVKPEIVKLDRSLIEGLQRDGAKLALLEALAKFAVTTGAAVCAEGVEEVDELFALARFDVAYAQGYAFGHPGPGWPPVVAEVARAATSEERWGMRLARPALSGAGSIGLGDVTEALARVRSSEDLRCATELIKRLAHAEDVAVSRVLPGGRAVQTLSEHDWGVDGEIYRLAEYPTTARVITEQVLGQVVAGDPAADPAELRLLETNGFSAVLLAPVVTRAETVGLLELYRTTGRPWTTTEIDQARTLAHHLGSALTALETGAGRPQAA
jgi:EAL domain-containing protein (putative c-di-GMP-specific phosphodiesterase class I)